MKKRDFSLNNIFKVVGKIFSWSLFVILMIAAIFLLYYFVATKIYAAKGKGYEPKLSIYTIVSPSMTPTIKVYDAIINVRIDKPEDIKKGDVITFISTSLLTPGTTITHRVVGITEDSDGNVCYQTKGDYNSVADQSCAKFSNVIGKVVFRIPQLGRIQFFLASKAGWLVCILVPALVIICRDILRIMKLSGIKNTVSKLEDRNKKDSKKIKLENERKQELKRKLLLKDNKTRYYEEPQIRIIEKKRNNERK